jgi:predicted unusual protein kinase regulating ubiquinone biosynthesis (AarF/ABC1/UbiB family)
MRSSRAGRLAQMGTLAGGQAARNAATRAANLTRSEARALAAAQARQAEMAERLVIVLGSMRGAAMKLGQMLSLVGGMVPPEAREDFNRKLAELNANAPAVPWVEMRGLVESQLGVPVERAFAEFDSVPVAAASIGQVYRARLHDGRAVAVKVQYPGIEAAVRADLKNFKLFLGMYARFAYEGLDAHSVATEIEDRVIEELDYANEARNTQEFADLYAGHPFFLVPNVIADLSTRQVLVTEWVEGAPLRSSYEAPLNERNRLAEILFRFYNGSVARYGLCNGDPHPGNTLVTPDGHVAFVDFGLVRRQPPDIQALSREALRGGAEGDGPGLKSALERLGFIVASHKIDDVGTMDSFLHLLQWYVVDAEVDLDPDLAARLASDYVNPNSPVGAISRHQNLPPEVVFWIRSEFQGLGTLGQLRPRLNLHRVAREWIFDEPPVTELGRAHAAWLASR